MSDKHGAERCAQAYKKNQTQENRDNVVFATEPVIRSIISRITRPTDDLARPDELYHVGVLAVLQALDQFDPDTGTRFVTFAYPRIRGEVIDFLRRLDPLPRRRRAKVAAARATFDRLAQAHGAIPDETSIAESMEVSVSDFRNIQQDVLRRRVVYLFDPKGDDEEGHQLIDVLADEHGSERFDEREGEDGRIHLEEVSEDLTERDRLVLELYFGEDMTLGEIGSIIGVSEARVSQLRRSALTRLADVVDEGLKRAA